MTQSGPPTNEGNGQPDGLAAYLQALEESLLDPVVRRDRAKVGLLLADDFLEFGSSGRVWSRAETFDLLASKDYTPPETEGFVCNRIATGVALITDKSWRTDPLS
jgi:hypothetical protein